jgi:hypothetical protein
MFIATKSNGLRGISLLLREKLEIGDSFPIVRCCYTHYRVVVGIVSAFLIWFDRNIFLVI